MTPRPIKENFMDNGVFMEEIYQTALSSWEKITGNEKVDAPEIPAVEEIHQAVISTETPTEENTSQITTPSMPTIDNLTFKVGYPVIWKVNPLTKDGKAANIQPGSLKETNSGAPNVEITPNDTGFTLLPIGVGSADIGISFVSLYGKLVSKTYHINVVDGADEAVDFSVDVVVQS